MCSKLRIKTPDGCTESFLNKIAGLWPAIFKKGGSGRGSGVFILNFEHILHFFLLFLLLTLNS